MLTPIDAFIEGYLREFDFYQEAARLCAQQCEKMLVANGIRAIVTHRAKRPLRLRDKLKKRDEVKKYSSVEEIRSDIVDLAGVRAALYFPGDRAKAEKLAHEAFQEVLPKQFPESGGPRHGKRFSGYHATHLRVRLRPDDLAEHQRRFASTTVEIQIASVLMHAWSEVEHDLIYKPLSGELSVDEHAILDELNGLVLSGEIALERLQRAVELRVSSGESRFTNHFELAAFLYEETKPVWREGAEPTMGKVDALYNLLRKAQLDTPEAVRPFVRTLDTATEGRSIADQVSDIVLAQRPELYSDFVREQRSESLASAESEAPDRSSIPQSVGTFLTRWVQLERFYRYLVSSDSRFSPNSRQAPSSSRYLLPVNAARLAEITGYPGPILKRIEYLRDVRNRLVHGIRVPQAALDVATGELDELFGLLEKSEDPRVLAAIKWARSDDDEPGQDPSSPEG